ncbi:hypothetical protein TW65_07976 [Stemphylium lycopersici]|uniref:Uncharacterized protein n=1 Tax=Stemphylium lycopersici TaxID=183478 RepID=A0A364MZW2_STELY|nr:hypothetical protein TW65_07976 [Stemphylium lycopersici]RAR08045.1 hypothetical protein DDE83_006145 [Stemphylium lycopersici]
MRDCKTFLNNFRIKATEAVKKKYSEADDFCRKASHRPVLVKRPPLRLFDYWMLTIRITAIGIIIAGITLGATQTYISIGLSRVFGEELDADLKLALLGLFNKTLDVFLRWYPNEGHEWDRTAHEREIMRIEYPKVSLQGVDWGNMVGVGQSNIGGPGYPPWDWALGLSASLAFVGLTHVVSRVKEAQKGWQHIYKYQLDGDQLNRWTTLNTNFNHSKGVVETASADHAQVQSIYDWLKETNHQPTSSSVGWTGDLTIVLPVLNTVCTPINSSNLEGSIKVWPPAKNVSSEAAIAIEFGPVLASGFTGAACSSVFRHGTYAVNVWIVDEKRPDLSFNSYGGKWDQNVLYEPTLASDFDVASGVGSEARDLLSRIESLVPATGLLPQFLLMSRNLQASDSVIDSDAMGLSIIMGVFLQNILSTSNRDWSPLPSSLPSRSEERLSSYPIRWQLYGSSPRLGWEWVAVAVLAIILLSFCFGLYQTLRYWMAPGSWVELDGMMMIAQRTPNLEDIDENEKAQVRKYLVEKDLSKGPEWLILKSEAR